MSRLLRVGLPQRRYYSSSMEALDAWISSPKELTLKDTFSIERVSDLFITLPTRDGSTSPYHPPIPKSKLGYGSHLAFFHPRNPQSSLREDGTDNDFCPPSPFTRRMWAGGSMSWNSAEPLLVGDSAVSHSTIASVDKKGFDKGGPMVFVKQKIEITKTGKTQPSVVEERRRAAVYCSIPPRLTRFSVPGLPPTADFQFTFTPSIVTLFRYSALTFNGHYIHLDKDYAQLKEGYPERLVHGPLTALMLLEITQLQRPKGKIANFEYRARNPVIVNKPMTIAGVWIDVDTASLWCVNDQGVVGMTGTVQFVRSK
ncbi:hypothetical protein FB45DRAFT_752716 [Roridomyces roridus]|uniref:MaoC-like domain-containing protein n=1 Tax=Roridomyces roridus TaxID=1738132 RepID=A0AAD7BKR3_9AGAR|nr:hypothetical protein FB45DRAFT_752716 [Roridomyces roridus]